MFLENSEKQLTKIIRSGLLFISVVVATQGITDPVNAPKLLLLAVFSFAILGLLIGSGTNIWKTAQAILIGFFLLCSVISTIASSSPFSQNIFGTYGRNNGLLTYFCLSILLVGTSALSGRVSHLGILKSLIYAGYVNLIYCAWVIVFGDFMPWNNTYGNILGTFGNPNFIGAFLGIFFGVQLSLGIGAGMTKRFKRALFVLLPVTVIEILETHAIQGRVLVSLSTAIILFFYLRTKFGRVVLWSYSIIVFWMGGFALAGAFQRGPLSEFIYKTSVSLRGQYWLAAWNTGEANPTSGAGMDAFGDWYRRARDIRAIELPGVNTVVNAAHNVPLDMFAFGGWPLFISYLVLVAFSLRSAFRISKRMKGYDSVGVALITAWICYQAQSMISINQIGLAIWGWALSGCLISYDRHLMHLEDLNQKAFIPTPKRNSKIQDFDAKAILRIGSFGFLGFLVGLPPLSADVTLRTAQVSHDAAKLESTMGSSFFNPPNSQKFILNVQAFEGSGLFDLSHKYALEGVNWNSESYELWRLLYLIKNSTNDEKRLAILNMKRLDPLNPNVTSTQ